MIASPREVRICFDRYLPDAASMPVGVPRMSLLKAKKFAPGTTLRVGFAGGTAELRKGAQIAAEYLMQFAFIDFRFNNPPNSTLDVRITFDPNQGAWSYLGTDSLNIPRKQATMNLGFENDRSTWQTAKHEFGHQLAAVHEHQVEGGINWNREAVYRRYSGPPNNWNKAEIDANVLETYSRSILNGTAFDPRSIMAYPVDPSLTLDGRGVGFNADLSDMDKQWLREQYPGRDGGPTTPKFDYNLDVYDLTPVSQSLSAAGERDLAKLKVEKTGRYIIEAVSRAQQRASLVLALFGPNNTTTLVAQTNNIGTDFDARIDTMLMPGEYAVQVSHADPSGVGEYGLRCLHLPQGDDLLDLPQGDISIGYSGSLLPGKYLIVKG